MGVKRFLPFILAFAMVGGVFAGCSSDDTALTTTDLPSDNKIYVVGDSTVCSYIKEDGTLTDNYYLPRYGYGTQLSLYLCASEDQIVNLALSGRSSKSFLTEENYTALTTNISTGDYLIIGFGHNDEKSAEAARFTDPNGTKDAETTDKGTSLKWCLYEKYIKMAKDKGATPILCTPITRYNANADYTGSSAHITSDGDYPEAIRELGKETDTTVIDLTALTVAEYTKDNAAAIYYHAHTTYKGDAKEKAESGNTYDGSETPDGMDTTHINKFGAMMVAYKFVNALKSTDCSLKNYINTDAAAPKKGRNYVSAINQDYEKIPYASFNAADYEANKLMSTTTNDTTVDWYHTAMGAIGGKSKVSQYTFNYASGTLSMTAGNGSKFSGTVDGFGAAFVQVDVSKNFKASARVKVTTVGSSANNQAGFGMMLRDDILIDTYDTTLATNFVAAGVVTSSSAGTSAIFSRSSSSALTKTENTATTEIGDEYDISIERTGQTVVVKFGSYTETFTDFDFVARDNDYMYLCLFAARDFSVEFTNISFEITGTSQGA